MQVAWLYFSEKELQRLRGIGSIACFKSSSNCILWRTAALQDAMASLFVSPVGSALQVSRGITPACLQPRATRTRPRPAANRVQGEFTTLCPPVTPELT
jgi:nitric oxide synthase oxygenase domain/subunit